jgi:nitrate/TMAO reductase-like tetraheme cytochrome c subunit
MVVAVIVILDDLLYQMNALSADSLCLQCHGRSRVMAEVQEARVLVYVHYANCHCSK